MTPAGSSSSASSNGFFPSLVAFARDIKVAHSIFALPFAASALVMAHLPLPTPFQLALLLVCMVTARSFAMGMNRYLDRELDAANPRTKLRKIPAGELPAGLGLFWSLAAAAVFLLCAFRLSPLAGYCAPVLLAILAGYSLMKRLTWATHWYLGMCLGLAPIAVEIALRGAVSPAVLAVGAAVTLWTAGFDLLYALQDMNFDREAGLSSFPARFGPGTTLVVSRGCFVGMIALLAAAGLAADRHAIYAVGLAVIAGILAYEQWIVRDARATGASTKLNLAFFNANAYVSVVFFAFVVADQLLA
jgi:4-hydroxybenzoate polyprenyltransferase